MIRHKVLLVLLVVFLVDAIAQAQQRGGGRGDAPAGGENPLQLLGVLGGLEARRVVLSQVGGAWWTNTALVARLGLTDDQKASIERVFESHRLTLESNKALLEKEEAQLGRLLEAEPFDRNAALAQTYRVIQARDDMERTNALMTLEMREHLTRAQWMQLPQPTVEFGYTIRRRTPGGVQGRDAIGAEGNRGGGGRGARGQQ